VPTVDELPEVMPDWASRMAVLDRQNGATLGRILGRGLVGQATEGSDGKMHATVRIPPD